MCRVCGLQFCGVEFVRSSLGGMGVCRHEQNEESRDRGGGARLKDNKENQLS